MTGANALEEEFLRDRSTIFDLCAGSGRSLFVQNRDGLLKP